MCAMTRNPLYLKNPPPDPYEVPLHERSRMACLGWIIMIVLAAFGIIYLLTKFILWIATKIMGTL